MATFSFLELPTQEQLQQIIPLYRQAGWWGDITESDPDILKQIIQGSHCFAVALHNSEIIGMGRAISDGVSDAYIQDVAVKGEYQAKGIGTRLIEMIIERLRDDNIGWIGLIAEKGSHPFYKKFGFRKMADATPLLLKK
jgi:spermidine synthase